MLRTMEIHDQQQSQLEWKDSRQGSLALLVVSMCSGQRTHAACSEASVKSQDASWVSPLRHTVGSFLFRLLINFG